MSQTATILDFNSYYRERNPAPEPVAEAPVAAPAAYPTMWVWVPVMPFFLPFRSAE